MTGDGAHLFVVTVTVALEKPDGELAAVPPGRVAEALMAHADVVTVCAEGARRPVVYRVDVMAAGESSAARGALAPAARVAEGLGLRADVRTITAVKEANRVEEFRRAVGGR